MRMSPAHLETFREARLVFIDEAIKFNITKKMLEAFLKKYILKEGLYI